MGRSALEVGRVAEEAAALGDSESLWTRILLATDGSEDSEAAATMAVAVSRWSCAELHLMHVWHDVPTAHFRGFVRAELEREGRDLLEEQAQGIKEAGGTIAATHLREGSAVDEILKASEELEVDLIVLGTRGLGPLKLVVLGSVSAGVLGGASVPVIVVPRVESPRPGEDREAIAAETVTEVGTR